MFWRLLLPTTKAFGTATGAVDGRAGNADFEIDGGCSLSPFFLLSLVSGAWTEYGRIGRGGVGETDIVGGVLGGTLDPAADHGVVRCRNLFAAAGPPTTKDGIYELDEGAAEF